MELTRRPKHDVYTAPGAYRELEARVRRRTLGKGVRTLFMTAFDRRTRLGPYVFVDKSLIPGAARAVGSALHAAGLTSTRLVLQAWSGGVLPSRARIDGAAPDLFLVSGMQIHSRSAYRLTEDAWNMGAARPLIIAGGAKASYEPWDFFGLGKDGRAGADVVVTGEEFVLLELLDRILEYKGEGESWREGFDRARAAGALHGVAGLVFAPEPGETAPEALVDTGPQRLVRDLDELPLPFDGLGLFEPPHKGAELAEKPLAATGLKDHAALLTVVMTHGCKFHCPYCPIPGYNQGTYRHKSPRRIVEELAGIVERSGMATFFGADDNFFNNREATESLLTEMARGTAGGKPFRDAVWIGTEATEHDVDRNSDLLPLAREAGVRAVWFGIEDMTASLVKKGQTPEKTRIVFRKLLDHDIAPMPMIMHHDEQPLFTFRGLYGLLNQVRFLRKVGAVSMQITFLTPMVGSKSYERYFEEGLMMREVDGEVVDDSHFDGNHCLTTGSARPWRKQANLFVAYAAFYNPLSFARDLLKKRDGLWKFRLMYQVLGQLGLARSIFNGSRWLRRLFTGRIAVHHAARPPKFPMIAADADFPSTFTGARI
ncbi:B12-binding domain-containing radical SAM protein [Planctomyces sp. SH-PL62]|uniref:B12-binding domain-containing radical SAM protein n=1 Tax=Planctomyces sp. SH-PL62 TaxID=1636152 RepID=UPI00078C28E6|nr:radical SAM protein [Planctomyces sp. SH-PL62]AMV40697.1 Radical SAM superfamily protein [Planctomyces sp. SH-PL62]